MDHKQNENQLHASTAPNGNPSNPPPTGGERKPKKKPNRRYASRGSQPRPTQSPDFAPPKSLETPGGGHIYDENLDPVMPDKAPAAQTAPAETSFDTIPQENPAAFIPPMTAQPDPSQGQDFDPYAPRVIPTRSKSGKKAAGVIGVVAVIAVVGICLWFFLLKDMFTASTSKPAYVSPVGTIAGSSLSGNNRYAGVVEPQKTVDVKRDSDLPLNEIFVTAGQEVSEGDILFSYDTAQLNITLSEANLALETYNSQITTLKNDIADLEKKQATANADQKLTISLQIKSKQFSITELEYQSSSKRLEVDQITQSIANANVLAEVSGVVKAVNKDGGIDTNGNPLPFISILTTSDYRIKGTASELTVQSLAVNQNVLIRSRIDDTQTWQGVIESIDYDNPIANNNPYIGNSTTPTSKYHFYITLAQPEGLMLGQHIYIEPETEDGDGKSGIWLPAYYLVTDGDPEDPNAERYVWAKTENDKLEKRVVTLGQYDPDYDLYEILSGLTFRDYLAVPSDTLKAGMLTTTELEAEDDPNSSPNGDPGLIDPGIVPGNDVDLLTPETGLEGDGTGNDDGTFEGEGQSLEDENATFDSFNDNGFVDDGSTDAFDEASSQTGGLLP